MELYQAANQWAIRPADERFTSLEVMHAASKAYADSAVERTVPWVGFKVEPQGNDLFITRGQTPAKLTHYAFGQLANRVGAPASYLRDLPVALAAQNLNHGLSLRTDGNAQLLFHRNSGLLLRAVTSEEYERVWNHEVIARLIELSARLDLEPGRQTFNWDKSTMTAEQVAAAPRSLYASDHDMFAFLMSRGAVINDPVGQTLRRGLIVANSEVGDRSLAVMGFYFRDVCCNHIIWGAEQIAEIRLTHVGRIRQRFQAAEYRARQWLLQSTKQDAGAFQRLTTTIAGTKEEVLDTLFGKRAVGLSRKALTASYDAVVPNEDGAPNTVWGFAQGVSRYSQTVPYADDRTQLDRAAGRILDLEF